MCKPILICFFTLIGFSASIPLPFDGPSYLPWKLGSCKDFGILELDSKFFNGHWYEQKSFGNYLVQADGICTTMEFEVKGTDAHALYYQYEPLIKKYIHFRGNIDLNSLIGSNFDLDFDYFAGLGHIKIPMRIIETDYDNYAIFYSCQEAFGFKAEMSWIATRKRGDTLHDDKIKTVLNNKGLDYYDYLLQKSTECGSDEPHL